MREILHHCDAIGDRGRRLVAHEKTRAQDRPPRRVVQDDTRELRRRGRETECPPAAARRGLGDGQRKQDRHLRELDRGRERVVVIDRGAHDDRVRAGLDRLAPKLEDRFRRTTGDVRDLQLHSGRSRSVLIGPELQRVALRRAVWRARSRQVEQRRDVERVRVAGRRRSRSGRGIRRRARAQNQDERDERPRARRASHLEAGYPRRTRASRHPRGADPARSRPARSPSRSRRRERLASSRAHAR